MQDERRQILTRLAEGKLTVTEAERQLDALASSSSSSSAKAPKSLRVIITPHDANAKMTDAKIPLGLIRTGIRFGAFMTGNMQAQVQLALKERGMSIDLSKLNDESIDLLSEALAREPIELNDERGHTRVYCE